MSPIAPQAGGTKHIKGLPGLHHMVMQIQAMHGKGHKVTLKELHPTMPFKPFMTEGDRMLVSTLAKDCMSELGKYAGEGSSSAGPASSKDAKKSQGKASVLTFFG